MKIGIISDTHDNLSNIELAIGSFRSRGIERIIHLGDWCSPFSLAKIASAGIPVTGIIGNNDGDISALMRMAFTSGVELENAPAEVEFNGLKFLLLHGYQDDGTTRRVVDALASTGRYDFVLYGHTHEQEKHEIGDTIILNPGECFGALKGNATVAILDTTERYTTFIQLKK